MTKKKLVALCVVVFVVAFIGGVFLADTPVAKRLLNKAVDTVSKEVATVVGEEVDCCAEVNAVKYANKNLAAEAESLRASAVTPEEWDALLELVEKRKKKPGREMIQELRSKGR